MQMNIAIKMVGFKALNLKGYDYKGTSMQPAIVGADVATRFN